MHLLQYFDKLSLKPENAKDLKGLILDLAVRGRLTEEWRKENPNVESASVLLERIKNEKARLVKEKIIRKEKTLPELLESEIPFALPEKWQWTKIGNIGEVFNGNSISKSVKESKYNHIEEGYVYLGTKDIGYGFERFNYETGIVIPYDEPKFKIAKKGTVLLCSEGGSAGKKCGITDKNICFGNKLYAIESFIQIEPVYILSLYLSKVFQTEFQERMTGIIGGISKNNFKDIPFPLPPLTEQKSIVKIVNQLIAEVEELEAQTKTRVQLRHDFIQSSLRQLTTADSQSEWNKLQPQFTSFFDTEESVFELKQAILQLGLQGKLTKKWREANPDLESATILLEKIKKEKALLVKGKKIKKEKPLPNIMGDETPFEVPNGWLWCYVGNIAVHRLGKMLDKNKNKGNPLQYLRNLNVKWSQFDLTDLKEMKFEQTEISKYSVVKNDVLICEGGYPGRAAIWKEDYAIMFQKALHRVRFIDQCLDPNIFVNYLKVIYHSGFIFNYVTGAGIKHFTGQKLRLLPVPLPPLQEQKVIVQIVNQLIEYCDKIESAIQSRNVLSKEYLQSSLLELMEKTQSLV